MVSSNKALYFLLLCTAGFAIVCVEGNKDTTYSPKEQDALVKFREAVKGITFLDYQNEDVYLIRWLRARNLDINRAKEMLVKSLQFRKQNKIDSILDDKELQKLRKPLPMSVSGVDREGRPVFQASFGSWDLRKFMLAGSADLVNVRYLNFCFESIMEKVREARKAGKDVSQWIFLVDMSNYSIRQHACLACVPFYLSLVNTYEAHHPQTASHIIIINTPRVFEAILQLIRPLMAEATQRDFQVLGSNKEEWQRILLDLIPPEQLTPQFGGTKTTSSFV